MDAQWIENRKNSIGASDCAVVMGFSPWKSAIELHYEKTGEIPVEDISDKDAIKMGIKLEPIVADLFLEKQHGYSIRLYGADTPTVLVSPKYDWMTCSPDAIITYKSGEVMGVEFKTTSEYNKNDWADGNVPFHYELQCQHSMAVTGYDKWIIACLIGGRTYVEQTIERDDDLIRLIISTEESFWNGVQTKTPPEYDGSESSWNVVRRLYSQSNGEAVIWEEDEATTNLLLAHDTFSNEIKIQQAFLKELQCKLDRVKQQLVVLLGNNERAYYGNAVIEYKTVERKEHTVAASSYRKFSIKDLSKKKKGE